MAKIKLKNIKSENPHSPYSFLITLVEENQEMELARFFMVCPRKNDKWYIIYKKINSKVTPAVQVIDIALNCWTIRRDPVKRMYKHAEAYAKKQVHRGDEFYDESIYFRR